MIESAEEFVELPTSGRDIDRDRATRDVMPEEVCRRILTDFPEHRIGLTRNETVPPSILRELADDEQTIVRRALAQNPRLDDDLMARLAGDTERAVRLMVAANPVTPAALLEQLATKDEWEGVRQIAGSRLRPTATDRYEESTAAPIHNS